MYVWLGKPQAMFFFLISIGHRMVKIIARSIVNYFLNLYVGIQNFFALSKLSKSLKSTLLFVQLDKVAVIMS